MNASNNYVVLIALWATANFNVLFVSADEVDANAKLFDRVIAPLLHRRCLDCHNETDRKGGLILSRKASAFAGGDSGKVIVPAKPDESLLWQHVRDDEMPPKKPLPADEKELLRRWIATGAKWGTDPIDPFRFTSDRRAGYDWWAVQPVKRPRLPVAERSDWVRNGIDAFILAKLAENELAPSAQAEPRTLIRRLSFDLLGLPPTPAEVRDFVSDTRPDAYERLVDRMLASPHYGIRWGRHWLDIVRFGESQGFERDKLRENSWPYRDWVVNALNRDMPYDQFARDQLAGDVLDPSNPAATIATGFLVAGPWDEVGQSQQSAAMKAVVRQDELEDVVSVVGQTFLGLTINCARCHDHKFDPVRQKEYYQMTAALAGVRHGERELISQADQKLSNQLRAQIQQRRLQVARIEDKARQSLSTEQSPDKKLAATRPAPIARWDFDDSLQDRIGKLHADQHADAKLSGGQLKADGKKSYAATVAVDLDLREKTLEAWVRLDNLDQRGGGVMSVQTLNGGVFDAIVFGEREPYRWMAGSNTFQRTQSFQGPEEKEADKHVVHVAIVYHGDGTIAGYRNGRPYGQPYKSSGAVTFKSGQSMVLFGLRHGSPGGNRLLTGSIAAAQLYDRALSPKEVAASAAAESDGITHDAILKALTKDQRRIRQQLVDEIFRLDSRRANLKPKKVYVVSPRQPILAHVLHRGNPVDRREVVAPGGVASLVGMNADFGLKPDAADADRRKILAAWVSDRKNPLFARVIVNRLWHYHFGIGLVDTPSDFGFNGGRPTHPKLIDYLASELIRSDFSLKHIHRLIVTSATYRQSSNHDERAFKIDADNRLLWKKTPTRLEAEAVRDTMLMVTGQLNRKTGGPGYRDFTTFTRNTQFYVMQDVDGPQYNRRSIYRTWVRSGRNQFLDAFDCPDPSTKSPKRAVTVTPLQALTLMNNAFVLRMSDRFAQRLRQESGDNVEQQIRRAFELAYSRPASDEELQLCAVFVREHGVSALCRVLLNSNAYLYVD